jgi:hypothetical protein
MKFSKGERASTMEQCGIPFCDGEASHTVKIGKNCLHLCERHFNKAAIPLEMKRRIDDNWFTEERKRRMFNPTNQEKIIMRYLAGKRVLEDAVYGGKASYRPTQKFHDRVVAAEVNLSIVLGYRASMLTLMEEGTRIALRQILPNTTSEEAEKHTEMVSPFVVYARMDRDLNPETDRYKHSVNGKKEEKRGKTENMEIEKRIVQRLVHEYGFKVQKIVANDADFMYRCDHGRVKDLVLFVSKPKDKADQVVLSLPQPWPYDSEYSVRKSFERGYVNWELVLSEIKKNLEKIGCSCRFQYARDNTKALVFLEISVPCDRLNEPYLFECMDTLTEGCISTFNILTAAQLRVTKVQEYVRRLLFPDKH